MMTDLYSHHDHVTKLIISEGVVTLPSPLPQDTNFNVGLFQTFVRLSTISLPTSLSIIGSLTFYSLSCLTDVDLQHTNLRTIGNHAFANCVHLLRVKLSLTYPLFRIGFEAFYNCKLLRLINLPEDNVEIGMCAFSACAALKTIANATTDEEVISYIKSEEYKRSYFVHPALSDLLNFLLFTQYLPKHVTYPKPCCEEICNIGSFMRNGGYNVLGEILSFLSPKNKPVIILPSRWKRALK
ncbi:hypothetical protein ScalyP_jg947 [Parmales sp. scaly parma]|nr:hypothetical protein ScalyP_jg947 [Parmales sp. scaly parma]